MSQGEQDNSKVSSSAILTREERRLWVIGSLMVMTAIALGAFGAHAVKSRVDEQALGWWETAASYHRTHGLSILMIAALWPRVSESCQQRLHRVAQGFCLGTVLFSGSLYTMTLTSIRTLGMITPIGGTLWLIAWGLFAWSVAKERD